MPIEGLVQPSDDALRPPPSFNFARDVLAAQAARAPGAPAIIGLMADGTEQRWTYADVAVAAARVAGAMHAAGLSQGDRLLVLLPRVPMFQIVVSACLHLGIVPVPCVTQLSAEEIAYRLRQSGARGLVTSAGLSGKCDALLEGLVFTAVTNAAAGASGAWRDLDELARGDVAVPAYADMPAETPALMYFTSGSSGPPKAVIHAARGVFVRGRQPWLQLSTGPGDVIWTTSDTGWTRAASCLLFGAFACGATALIAESGLDPAQRVAMMARHGVSLYAAVSTDLRQVMARSPRQPLPRLRWTLSAGEAMTEELATAWRAFSGAPLLVGYGQTETPTATLTDPATPARNGMIGRPMRGNHVDVVDAAGVLAAAGIEGQIVFDAGDPGLLLGYWQDGRVVPSPRLGRWHVTGDVGFRDERGDLYFVGRDDDVISSSGYRIGPTEVENALAQHPAVVECAVAASPDAERGEIVKAFVVLDGGAHAGPALVARLQEFVRSRIAPYKYPRAVAFVDSLPRTATGKISRRLLREAEFAAKR